MPELQKILVIGGGLAGLTAAYWAKRQFPQAELVVFERQTDLLPWIPDGKAPFLELGRAGIDEADPELLFHRGWPEVGRLLEKWPGSSTHDWLRSAGLPIQKTENGAFGIEDGRMLRTFFKETLEKLGIEWITDYSVESISAQPDGSFRVWSTGGNAQAGRAVLLATGGERNHGMALAREFGLETRKSLPAYLRLKPASPKLGSALGPLQRCIRLRCPRTGQTEEGLAGFSSRGLEGPVLSTLSSGFAEDWSQRRYRLTLEVDWVPELSASSLRSELESRCLSGRRKPIGEEALFAFTERQWLCFLELARIDPDTPWIRLKTRKLQALVQRLKNHAIAFSGMGLPSGERAWAGGVPLEEIDWKNGAARSVPGLHFAGEILDFLGKPGGAQLNAIWASAYLSGTGIAISH